MSAQAKAQRRADRLPVVALAALGVVFGDIGTSPLYTLHECMVSIPGGAAGQIARYNVLGVLSLVFWSLTLVVTVKYLTFIMRADNHGEGGIFSLLALIPERMQTGRAGKIGWAALVVVVGAGLLYGDGMITPAISVLSAMEGLETATPVLKPLVLPLTCAVLIGLFAIQHKGTGKVGAFFGPIMVVWFATIASLGVFYIARYPSILVALNPAYAFSFFVRHGPRGIHVLGAVVLAVTGGEALYADLGHFGCRPIRVAWLAVVMPALVLNYFGQGALLLNQVAVVDNPFFAMAPPGAWTYALVGLSAAATVIASQALISGVFSLTHQAVQMGFLPRVTIRHTSLHTEGQIYVPEINWMLAVACIALVLTFRDSSRLAAAYGVAVTGTMAITSIVYFEVTRTTWKWPLWRAVALLVLFLSFDIPFFVANIFKIADGGYVPVLVGVAFFIVMITWKRGRLIYRQRQAAAAPPFDAFLASLGDCERIPGSAIFLTGPLTGVPSVLVQHVDRIRALPETVLLLTIAVTHVPHESAEAMHYATIGKGISSLTIDRGFMDEAGVLPPLAEAIARFDLKIDLAQTTFFLGRVSFLATAAGEMGRVAETLFAFLSRNARSSTAHFGLPPENVVEIGSQIDL